MSYLSSIIFLFILFSYSNFLNLKFRIKLNETYFFSLCIIILVSYIFFTLSLYYNSNFLEKTLFAFFFISLISLIYLVINCKKINFRLNLEFILIYLLLFLLSKDRYYLDQDEFTYWSLALKALTFDETQSLVELGFPSDKFSHHPQGLNVFRNLFILFEFDEGMTIFSNNIILLSGFFFLFYRRSLSIIEKFFLITIYILLLNNLSFGLGSIYSDPILAIFYACLISKIFFNFFDKNFDRDFSIIIIFISILLINRSSIIYFLYALYMFAGLYFINIHKKKNKYKLIKYLPLILFIIFLIYEIYVSTLIANKSYEIKSVFENLFSINLYLSELLKLFITSIYFSNFGVTINTIFEIIFSFDMKINEFKIPLITYLILFIPFFFFDFKFKWFCLFSIIFMNIFFMILVFILKVKIENIHISAIPRYIGILFLANYLFIISIIVYKKQNFHYNFFLIFFLLFLFSVTPKKTLGFFVTKNIYYKSLSNKKFKTNRDNISKINKIKKKYDNFLIIHKENYSDYKIINVTGEHSFYHNIIEYEIFPKTPNYIEYMEYLTKKDKFKKEDTLFILFDLPPNESSKIKPNINFFEINTY